MVKEFCIHLVEYFMKDHSNKAYQMEKAKLIFLAKCVIIKVKYIKDKHVEAEFSEIIKITIVLKDNGFILNQYMVK